MAGDTHSVNSAISSTRFSIERALCGNCSQVIHYPHIRVCHD
ncbi:MAG: hypothetical protein KAG53_01975 [Endozoicomonadaceae bacterium]|nr:hypothetical protein [Endozoicomonadaceae bacterium]